MALNPTAPGVYIQEISTLPPSVVPVPTAIPVFIGYTETALIGGVQWAYPSGLATEPIRIESFLQFQAIFGGAFNETFTVTLTGPNVDIAIAQTSNPKFRLFYDMQMYFANGGGNCYVISTGLYSGGAIVKADLENAISRAELVDEITLVVVPEAISISSNTSRRDIYDEMLAHCAKMQSRFALIDVLVKTTNTIKQDSDDFRNDTVGANNLSYGASYYPSFQPGFGFSYLDSQVGIIATDPNLPPSVQAFGNNTHSLDTVNNGVKQVQNLDLSTYTLGTGSLTINSIVISLSGTLTVDDVVSRINTFAGTYVSAFHVPSTTNIHVTNVTAGVAIAIVYTPGSGTITITTIDNPIAPDKVLYNRIKAELDALPLELYPSSMMAGIYASVDNNRGVWKAPANVGVSLVASLNRNITEADQGGLNVDPTSGKSIDAIRFFNGRGLLVWGARTLAGNSNDFRYVNVRRTLIFIEHSCKLASEFVVFEPNDKNTWLRVKGMIGNFLTDLWRDGGLVGDKPEQAFFVKVGLGETMTAQDILEGKLIVTIGLAISHPAEFIILQFMHKLQEA